MLMLASPGTILSPPLKSSTSPISLLLPPPPLSPLLPLLPPIPDHTVHHSRPRPRSAIFILADNDNDDDDNPTPTRGHGITRLRGPGLHPFDIPPPPKFSLRRAASIDPALWHIDCRGQICVLTLPSLGPSRALRQTHAHQPSPSTTLPSTYPRVSSAGKFP